MKVGDLVRIIEPEPLIKDVGLGTVLKFDVYGNTDRFDARFHQPDEPIVEVLWGKGNIYWIMQKKLEVVSEG
jgi:hypothetical protein